MLDNILKHFEKKTQPDVTHPHNRQIEEDTPVNITSDTQQKDTKTNRIAVNNDHKGDPNYMTVKSSSEKQNENTTHTSYER